MLVYNERITNKKFIMKGNSSPLYIQANFKSILILSCEF